MHKEIKSKLNSGPACYHLVKNLLSVWLISTNIKIKIYRSINLHLVYGCETWSSTLMEEHTLKMLINENGYKLEEVTGDWRISHTVELHGVYCSGCSNE
jgi:hypothetical protein